MSSNSDIFSSIIKAKIDKYATGNTISEEGKVISVSDGIVIALGLKNVMLNELVLFSNGSMGMALNLETDYVGIVMLDKYDDIKENSIVKRTKTVVSIGVGDGLIGRIVDPLGRPIDGKGQIKYDHLSPIDKIAPGVMQRKSVNQSLSTGILAIDSMFPIGKGQRELIIGDRQTGKTTIAIDTILNQKGRDVYCVYVAIGQKNSSVVQTALTLSTYGAMDYTTIISATASDIPALKYIAPFSGITVAEEWMKKGKDVLIIFDDLSKHAVSYRTISLLLKRPPGREAYPGDVFYLHSRLLERAVKLNDQLGAGSITALPIIETQAGDVSAYIPTNVISITDGQIFLESGLFNSGIRPAINAGISVSRVGGAAQTKAIKQVAGKLRLDLAQYRELEAFAQFASDLDASTKKQLLRGEKLTEVLKQPQYMPLSVAKQVSILFAANEGYLDEIDNKSIVKFKREWFDHFEANMAELIDRLNAGAKLEDDDKEALKQQLQSFLNTFTAGK